MTWRGEHSRSSLTPLPPNCAIRSLRKESYGAVVFGGAINPRFVWLVAKFYVLSIDHCWSINTACSTGCGAN